jgi:diguanylate cyclase (GGDEF)-like protein
VTLPAAIQRRGRSSEDVLTARPPRLVLRFALYSGVLLAFAAGSILLYVRHSERGRAERAATREARLVTDTLLAERLRRSDFDAPVVGNRRETLDRLFARRVVLDGVVRADLVDPHGKITYSTDHELIGRPSVDQGRVIEAMSGSVVSSVGSAPEGGELLHAFVPVTVSNGGHAGAVVLSQDYAPVAAAARKVLLPVVILFEAILIALYVALFPILRRVTNRLRHQMEALEHTALHDPLTGLPNRMLFGRYVEQAVQAAQREDRGVAVMMLDLDRFKEINDTLGHASGDLLLQELAHRLSDLLGTEGNVARLGGDEFGVVSRLAVDRASSLALAERIRQSIGEPFVLAGIALEVHASVGIALHPDHGSDVETLMRHADVAMYEAKKTHQPRLYRAVDNHYSSTRLARAGRLRHAIERDELELAFQPQVDLTTGQVHTAEALVRWRHPEQGLLLPDDFIPLAEHSGLIRPLTHWTLRTAIGQAARWKDDGLRLAVAVNVSGRDIVDLTLPDEIEDMLREFGLEASVLELEITESTLMTDPVRATTVIRRLSELGVRIAIDDFGSGYSSLSHLRRLAVDVLKIDKSFVLNMDSDENDLTIVRSTIDLAHNLGLTVVAEGVEDDASLGRLVSLGCDSVQGFHLSRPVSAPKLTAWLNARKRRTRELDSPRPVLRSVR